MGLVSGRLFRVLEIQIGPVLDRPMRVLENVVGPLVGRFLGRPMHVLESVVGPLVGRVPGRLVSFALAGWDFRGCEKGGVSHSSAKSTGADIQD